MRTVVIAAVTSVLMFVGTARADWTTVCQGFSDEGWLGSYTCVATNATPMPATVWIEVQERAGGTVEPSAACTNVPPGVSCSRTSYDSRARCCQVQWNGPPRGVKVVDYQSKVPAVVQQQLDDVRERLKTAIGG